MSKDNTEHVAQMVALIYRVAEIMHVPVEDAASMVSKAMAAIEKAGTINRGAH